VERSVYNDRTFDEDQNDSSRMMAEMPLIKTDQAKTIKVAPIKTPDPSEIGRSTFVKDSQYSSR